MPCHIPHNTAFPLGISVFALFSAGTSVSVKIVLNHEHIILFHFHSLFMASDSFRRHGHLCLCFMVFRLQFFAWNKENGTQWNVLTFSTGWYKLELFTFNLMHCVLAFHLIQWQNLFCAPCSVLSSQCKLSWNEMETCVNSLRTNSLILRLIWQ